MMIVGILPTLGEQHLHARALSANPRYALLNEQIFAARGEDLHLSIGGVERLSAYADSIAPEAACTSVQLHQLVHPDDFPAHWNAAQAVAGIQLAVGANSPFFFGKELWRETRIALFEQATDTRPEELKAQGVRPRVWFGERWITSIFDLFEENVRYFPALLPLCEEEDPEEVLERGDTPALHELKLHNGTVYRWNRPVYEVVRGRPHVRVENRVLPAGRPSSTSSPTPPSTTGWSGRSPAPSARSGRRCRSRRPRTTCTRARRDGLDARVYWPGVGDVPVTELVLRRLLPLAHEGLEAYGVDPHARDRLLGIIERRCVEEANGATWQARTFRKLYETDGHDRADALREMTVRYREHMHGNEPVHTWPVCARRGRRAPARRGRAPARRRLDPDPPSPPAVVPGRRDRVRIASHAAIGEAHDRRCGRAPRRPRLRRRATRATVRVAPGSVNAAMPWCVELHRPPAPPAVMPAVVELQRGHEAGRRRHRVRRDDSLRPRWRTERGAATRAVTFGAISGRVAVRRRDAVARALHRLGVDRVGPVGGGRGAR